MDNYFTRPEISASDLLTLRRGHELECTDALIFGTLYDNLILTPSNIDYFSMEVECRAFTKEQLETAEAMQEALVRHPNTVIQHLVKGGFQRQVVFTDVFEGFARRCKYDFIQPKVFGGDLKSTACTTQKQFQQSIEYFGYDIQRAWYMDISGLDSDLLIGQSKAYPYDLFVLGIKRGDAIYSGGRRKYIELLKLWGERYGNND